MIGTARYASPEQAQGQAVDGRADVYSLALVLYEAMPRMSWAPDYDWPPRPEEREAILRDGGLATWGDGRLFVLGTDGYLEIRKNVDIAGRNLGSHLFSLAPSHVSYRQFLGVEPYVSCNFDPCAPLHGYP